VAQRYRQEVGTPAPQDTSSWLREGDDLHDSDLSKGLKRLTASTIREFQKIQDMQSDGADQHFPTVLRAKVAAGSATLSTQVKVDENQMRAAVVDRLPELLEILREEEIKYALRQQQKTG